MTWQGSDDFLERIRQRLIPLEASHNLPVGGEDINLWDIERSSLRDAGVLIALIDRGGDDLHVVLTERPKSMATHPGQVALPGGKVDRTDAGPVAAAIREAHEEVGIDPENIDLIGKSDIYLTRTGFAITPVIGLLPVGFQALPDPYEVDEVFETPMSFLMNPDNHIQRSANWAGSVRHYYEMPHNGHRIWGVTAGMIHALYERIYVRETAKL